MRMLSHGCHGDRMTDQLTFDDPRTRYPKMHPRKQLQDGTGLQSEMKPVPDLGEQTYRGTGRLTGRRALITGGDSGIGGATAIAFAREGADVVIAHLPAEQSDADHVLEQVRAAGVQGFSIPGDLTDPAYCRSLVASAIEQLGGLDAIVIVAGKQVSVKDLTELSDEQFVETYEVNVFSAFRIIKAALPHLEPGSTVVTTASLETYMASEERVDYASTKAAINNLSKGIAQQLAPKGIRVNTVAPGFIATEMTSGLGDGEHDPDRVQDRSQARAELDAAHAVLLGLNRVELEHLLGTFAMLRVREERLHGRFVTAERVLFAYDQLDRSVPN